MEGFADFVLGDEGVEGGGKFGGVEGNRARKVGVEEAFDHAGEEGDVEGAGDLAGGGVGDDEGFGIVGEFEEVEVEADLVGGALFGDADVELGPGGSVKDGEALLASLEDLHQFDHLVGVGTLFVEFGRFVVGGEVGDEVDDVLVALFWGDGEGFAEDFLHAGGKKGEVDHAVAQFAHDQFIGDHSEGVDVGGEGGVGGMFALLGSHVVGGAHHGAGRFGAVIFVKLGDAEVDHFHFAIFGDDDVFRFEVAVDDAVGVEMAEGVGHLEDDREAPFEGERLLHEKLA